MTSEQTITASIRKACSEFMRLHPEYLPSPANEATMLRCAESPDNDHLNFASVAGWEDVYHQVCEQLEQPPATRRQAPRRVAPPSTLTYEQVNAWSASRLQHEIERSPERAAQIEAALSRR